MKVKRNEWQKHEVGCFDNFVMMKALKIVEKSDSSNYVGVEYEKENGETEVLYSHKSDIDFNSFE